MGHKILLAAYIILKDRQPYKDLGADFLIEKKKDKKVCSLMKQLKNLGVEVMVLPTEKQKN